MTADCQLNRSNALHKLMHSLTWWLFIAHLLVPTLASGGFRNLEDPLNPADSWKYSICGHLFWAIKEYSWASTHMRARARACVRAHTRTHMHYMKAWVENKLLARNVICYYSLTILYILVNEVPLLFVAILLHWYTFAILEVN